LDIAKKSISAAKYTALFKSAAQLISVGATIFLIRALSEEDFGIYNLLYSFISLLGMVASFGLANALQRYIPEYYSKGEFRIADNLYRISSIIRLLSNVLVLGLGLIFWDHIAPYLKIIAYKNYFMLFTVIILLHMQRGLLEICLNAFFLQKHTQGFAVVFIAIKTVGYALAILLKMDLWRILIIDFVAYIFVFVGLQVIYYKKIPTSGGHLSRFDGNERRRVARYAFFYNFNDAGAGILDTNFDNFIIVMYLNPLAVGAYAFCNRITRMIIHFNPVNYLQDIIRPAFFYLGTSMGTREINRFYQALVKVNYLFYVPVFIFVLVMGQDIIRFFFGGKFIEYSHVLTGVFLFSTLNFFQMPLGFVAQLKERAALILYSKVFAAYNIVADIILIKYFGIWGAVIATGTAVLGKNLFIFYFVSEEASFKGMGKFFSKIIVFWLIAGAMVFGIRHLVSNFLVMFSFAVIVFSVGFVLQFRTHLFNDGEKLAIERIGNSHKKLNYIIKLLRIQPA